MRKKKKNRKKNKKKPQPFGLLVVLFFIFLLGLFSETVRTLPVGAFSEKTNFYDITNLSSKIFDDKLINSLVIVKKAPKNELLNKEVFSQKTQTFIKPKDIIENKIQDKIIKESELKIVKLIESEKNDSEIQITNQDAPVEDIVNVEELKETIKIAADTSTTTISIDGEETLIPGSSEKNITYMQILQKPNDLDLNLKYARQQGKAGNFKQTIATLERLNMVYPDNVEIKLYLLSVLVQADAPDKALTIIEEIKTNEDLTPEDLATVNEIEEQMKERKAPRLWNFYADISLGGIQNENVNSVSKTRLQSSSDSLIGFNTPKHDRTYSGSFGLTATRSIGEASSLMINANVSDSEQDVETSDDFESYGLTLALDTSLGNQSLSPYFMLSKTDYQDDADSFSLMYGIGGYFSVGERNSFSYGYSFSDSKGNHNSADNTAQETNSIGHGFTLGHDYMINEIISTSIGLGYSDSDAVVDAGNDYETYDASFRLNLAYPWAYISIGDALSFNDYKKEDTSVNSNMLRSDVTNTFDIMMTKSVGDIFPKFDPTRSLFMTISYEKIISEANIINYDYIADSYSLSFSKSFHLNK